MVERFVSKYGEKDKTHEQMDKLAGQLEGLYHEEQKERPWLQLIYIEAIIRDLRGEQLTRARETAFNEGDKLPGFPKIASWVADQLFDGALDDHILPKNSIN